MFPLWPRPDAQTLNARPVLGTLRLGEIESNGKTNWLDELQNVTATFRPGYTEYQLVKPDARIVIAPALDFHGFICRVEFERDTRLVWQYGGVWWQASEANTNRVEIVGSEARITEANLPNGLVLAAWDGAGVGRVFTTPHGQQAEFAAIKARKLYHLVATWGVTRYDQGRADKMLARLDAANAAAWPGKRDELKKLWFDNYVTRALEPKKHLRQLLGAPAEELRRAREFWDQRRAAFEIHTPDVHLNALSNWARCVSEYHRQGPGLILGGQQWEM